MPRGFVGAAARKFLTNVFEAHTRALESGQRVQARAEQHIQNPQQAMMRIRQLPFEPEDAKTGTFTTGRRDSSNIVADYDQYHAISSTISRTDDQITQCMYEISCEIEALCQTSFKMPATTERCAAISDTVKRTLVEARAQTDDIFMQARKFADSITSIGM